MAWTNWTPFSTTSTHNIQQLSSRWKSKVMERSHSWTCWLRERESCLRESTGRRHTLTDTSISTPPTGQIWCHLMPEKQLRKSVTKNTWRRKWDTWRRLLWQMTTRPTWGLHRLNHPWWTHTTAREIPKLLYLPYIEHISEHIKQVCRQIGVKTVFKSNGTLWGSLMKVKNPRPPLLKKGVVYRVPCLELYISETGRNLKRLVEHKAVVKKGDTHSGPCMGTSAQSELGWGKCVGAGT